MRIIIDLQGAQSSGSRNRGIGRYSTAITKSIIKNSASHEVVLVLNGLFPESVNAIRNEFSGLIDPDNFYVWIAKGPVSHIYTENNTRRLIAEYTYEAFISSLRPDFIYVTSLFEGLVDDATTSIHSLQSIAPVAVTLYDLIPLINPDPYLENPSIKSWYLEKIENLKKADIALAISESSRQEGIDYLNFTVDNAYNISTDADEEFEKLNISSEEENRVRESYGLTKPFIMYTGGIDHRKNIEGLIRSFAMLPGDLKENYQLAIVCSIQPDSRQRLEVLGEELGLKNNELVLTDFVPVDHLVTLYNICRLFVFPSWHEGFGLPALEAIRCGAPVIGANSSSLPEVIGCQDALFNPKSDEEMSRFIEKGLIDESYRHKILTFQQQHAAKFSWDESAKTAIAAMEEWHRKSKEQAESQVNRPEKLKLAYLSPLPPAKSGIADYSAELLPTLSELYDIDVIIEQEDPVNCTWVCNNLKIKSIDWFKSNYNHYDRIIYHFGNSTFHEHMFNLIDKTGGVVVLHDFFLSGIQAHRELHGIEKDAWSNALYKSHGYKALIERFTTPDLAEVIYKYPGNLTTLQSSTGVIVHCEHSAGLAKEWFGVSDINKINVMPLLRAPAKIKEKELVRKSLGFESDAIIVCTFGVLGQSKLNHRLLDTWLNSPLAQNKKCYLVFVGGADEGEYCQSILKKIKKSCSAGNIKITGWIDDNGYKDYLVAADIGVQLRTLSRGETSAAVLDCMNYGLPTIVNAHGSMAELKRSAVVLLADYFTDKELERSLIELVQNKSMRTTLGEKAKGIIAENHSPEKCSKILFDRVEAFYEQNESSYEGLINRVSQLELTSVDVFDFATNTAQNYPPLPRNKRMLIDISRLCDKDNISLKNYRNAFLKLLNTAPKGFLIEPVYYKSDLDCFFYARTFTCDLLNIPNRIIQDERVDVWKDDALLFLGLDLDSLEKRSNLCRNYANVGVKHYFSFSELNSLDYLLNSEDCYSSEIIIGLLKMGNILFPTKLLAEEFCLFSNSKGLKLSHITIEESSNYSESEFPLKKVALQIHDVIDSVESTH